MNIPKLTLAFSAAGAIASRRIVAFNDNGDTEVVQAAASDDTMFGVTSDLDVETGEPADVVVSGSASVEYGDTITAGMLLTSDSEGRAIPAAAGNRTIGVAMQSGLVQDVGSVLLNPSQI